MTKVSNTENPITQRNRETYEVLTSFRSTLLKNLRTAKAKMTSAMLRLCLSDPNNISGSDKTHYFTSRAAYNKLNMELDLLDAKRFDLTHGLFV